MIGIGIDTVDIARFVSWKNFSDKKLRRIFSVEEIRYARKVPALFAARLAARFAAREALFKALCQAFPEKKFSFLTLCAATTLIHENKVPTFEIKWELLEIDQKPSAICSLSHTKHLATAIVMVQRVF